MACWTAAWVVVVVVVVPPEVDVDVGDVAPRIDWSTWFSTAFPITDTVPATGGRLSTTIDCVTVRTLPAMASAMTTRSCAP